MPPDSPEKFDESSRAYLDIVGSRLYEAAKHCAWVLDVVNAHLLSANKLLGLAVVLRKNEQIVCVKNAIFQYYTLPLENFQEKSCLFSVFDFLKRNVLDSTKLETTFKSKPHEVGLLVSERLINIPEELAPPLYNGLLDEVSWATEDEPTKALRDSFKFKQFLIISRIFQQLPKKKKKTRATKKQKNQQKQESIDKEDSREPIYIKPEDELLHRLSDWSCLFPANSEAAAAHEIQGLKQFRLVMLLSAENMEVFKSQFCIAEL